MRQIGERVKNAATDFLKAAPYLRAQQNQKQNTIRMKVFFILITSSLLVVSCNTESKDSPEKGTDSASSSNSKFQDTSDTDELSRIMSEFINLYSTPIIIDTQLELEKDRFEIILKHVCLFDSSIHLSKKYLQNFYIDTFMTHNFESTLRVIMNGKEIINTKIKKTQFKDYLDKSLMRYGVLLYPTIGTDGMKIPYIDYSISIPLTDVGMPVRAKIVNNKLQFVQR